MYSFEEDEGPAEGKSKNWILLEIEPQVPSR